MTNIKLNKKQWELIGIKTGWIKSADQNKVFWGHPPPNNQPELIGRGKLNLKEGTVDFSVGWDSEYADYTIYFPSIELGEAVSALGVDDQVIRLTTLSEEAKKVFYFIQKKFENKKDMTVHDVFRYIDKNIRNNIKYK